MLERSPKPARNDPCPCGSGKKYKQCCGQLSGASPAATMASLPADVTSPRPVNPGEIGVLIAMVNQHRLADAEYDAREKLAAHPYSGMLWKILSVALLRQGKDALSALRRAAELLPRDAEAHRNLGSALCDQGQWSAALDSLRRALEIEPLDAATLLDAANATRALGHAREAIALYQQALHGNARLAEAHNNLGNAFLELGEHEDAQASYRRALEIEPSNAQLHCNLGNAAKQLGLLDEAVAASRRAIELDPALSTAHNTLGVALAAQGKRTEAVASYRQALTLAPEYVEALNNLGNALRDLGERGEAAAHYARAIELDSRHAESHCNLGNALLELRRIDEAAESFRRALIVAPRYALAHVSLGTTLRLQRRVAEAEASVRAALAIEPANLDALCLLADLQADQGRFSEAEHSFRQALAIEPTFAFAISGLGALRKMTSGDTEWLQAAESSLATRLPRHQEIGLRYSIGKYFDDVGDYDEAFAYYRQANELTKRLGSSYDRAKLSQRIDAIIARFDAAFVRARHEGASSSQVPVFIVGMPRSGTSLAEQMLASHPAVFGAGELVFWDSAFAAYKRVLEGDSAAGVPTRAVDAAGRALAGIGRDYLELLTAQSVDATRVVDKMPANFLYAGLIHASFPNARIIHMQRHPMDTCLSVYFQNFFNVSPYANDLDDLAHYYGEYIRITDHWRAVLPETALLEVPYEALTADPERWIRRMLDFIALPWDPRCLEFYRTDRVVITASKWQVRQKIHTGSAGRWRHYEKYLAPLRRLIGTGALR